MPFVLDASSCLPWCFKDEATTATNSLLQRASGRERIFVPAHWSSEILNALTRAARRGRIEDQVIDKFAVELSNLHIYIDHLDLLDHWNECLPFVRMYQLSAYDAAYLALAVRLAIPLATQDDRLRDAARVEGVPLLF